MIVYHKNKEIDREQWDNCVRNSPGHKPYGYSWYLDIMAPGWEALVDDEYDSVFPIPCSSKFGINYIATPVFLQQLGAFCPDQPADKDILEFLHYLPDFYRLIDLNIAQKIDAFGFKSTERWNYELDLSKPYEKIRENFSSACRRNIEIAEKRQPEIETSVTPDELIDLFILNKGREITGIKPRDYQRLKNLMNFCLKNRKGKITAVRGSRKRLIYGLFTVEIKGSITMLFTVNTPQSRERKAGYYVINEIIKNNSQTRTILDFAGSSIPEVATFIESFGAVRYPYYRIYRNRLFWPVRMIR